jgi:hypothetical protein
VSTTAEQLELDLDLAPVRPVPRGLSIDEAFEIFHRENPHIYRNLRVLALAAVRSGRPRVGIRLLWEQLRWQYTMNTKHDERDYAMNDHYHSRYARLLMRQEPELAGVFETRRLVEADGEGFRL